MTKRNGRGLHEFWGAWSDETAARAREAMQAERDDSADRLGELYE